VWVQKNDLCIKNYCVESTMDGISAGLLLSDLERCTHFVLCDYELNYTL